MPPPIKVDLLPHSGDWELIARDEVARLLRALRDCVVAIHHIGSTAIPGIHAKPIIDLMPVVQDVKELDAKESVVRQLGYMYWGEYGIAGRRYCTLNDLSTGKRLFQLHCFESSNPEIARHLAFRDYLRVNPMKALEYNDEKRRCQQLHPNDSHAYSNAKADWIVAQLPAALDYFRSASDLTGSDLTAC